MFNPFVSMSFIAAHTSRIGVGVSVLIMPYRNPIATAKAMATLDRMSGGRLIAGIGVGWNEVAFAALGVPFHERGARTNEYLRLWRACWAPGKGSRCAARPGSRRSGSRRRCRWRSWSSAAHQACEAIECEPIPTRMSFRVEFSNITGNTPPADKERPTGHGTPAEVAADLLRYREAAGLEAFQINFHGNRDLKQLLQSIECFMREVKPLLT